MNFYRVLTLAWSDIRLAWRKPLPIVLLVLLAILIFGLSAGGDIVSAGGDGDIGGKRQWINSETRIAMIDLSLLGLLIPFFVSVQCGLSLVNDEDNKIDKVLLSTPLSPLEYTFGRFLGSLVPILVVLGLFLGLQILITETYPRDQPDALGPFEFISYLRPLLLFTLPLILFSAGIALVLGTLSRQAVLVFAIPTVLVVFCGFFLWNFNPSWLPRWIDKLLEWIDPAGVRWCDNFFSREPRGADFLNSATVIPDLPMLISRALLALIGMACIPITASIVRRRLRGHSPAIPLVQILAREMPPAPPEFVSKPMPQTWQSQPGWMATVSTFLRHELRALLRSPGLWLFIPLIILQVVIPGLVRTGPFETFVLSTPGSIAGDNFDTLSLLLIFLFLYYTVESLVREKRHGLSSIVHSTPVATGAMLTGKLLASTVVAFVVALCAFLGALGILIYQYSQTGIWFGLQPLVFLRIWGLILAPTLIVWSAYVMLLYNLTNNRYATYALGLGTLIGSGYLNRYGYLNWASLWFLWGGVRWSELDQLQFNLQEIFWNRLLMLSVSALLIALALRFFPRRIPDARGIADRFQVRRLLRWSFPMILLAIPAITIAVGMLLAIRNGPEGGILERKGMDYWKQNVNTWKDTPSPALDRLQARVDLYPDTRSFDVEAECVVTNRSTQPMDAIPVTLRPHLKVSSWKVDGQEIKPVKPIEREGRPSIEDRSGLLVVRPEKPLDPGASVRLGFTLQGTLPRGWKKKPGEMGQFVIPSGIVLVSFDGSFMPLLGFNDEIGLDENHKPEAREYPDDYYKNVVDPLFGPAWGTDVEMTISAPADWTVNGVGDGGEPTIASGRKTITWKTGEKVRFFNIVGGPSNMIETKGSQSSVFHAREHSFHAGRMAEVLDGARKYYGQWFHPYPWQSLRLTEFPGLASYAQGFPGNITFSESIGFLAKKAEPGDADTVDYIVAHEAAHQWWGNILTPGKGPGGNILSEGTANFSSLLLLEQLRGVMPRRALLAKYEREYVQSRNPDRERPLHKTDGSRPGDSTVTYNRAGFVFWMLMEEMGRDNMLKGCREFILKFKNGPDFPLIEDFVLALRTHAPDKDRFDTFVNQWIYGKVLPEFTLSDINSTEESTSNHVTTGTIKNSGTGTITVEVVALTAQEKADREAKKNVNRADLQRLASAVAVLKLAPGETESWVLKTPFKPAEVVVDPDVKLLQMGRKLASKRVP